MSAEPQVRTTERAPRQGPLRWLLRLGAVALAVGVLSSSILLVLSRAPDPSEESLNPGDPPAPAEQPRSVPSKLLADVGSALQAVWPLPRDRFTVLLLGSDRRPRGVDAGRSDTIILASLDPRGKTAALVSIPRDLWVTMRLTKGQIKTDRINTATVYGDAARYPGGGIGLLKDTLTATLGVKIDRWVRVELSQFPKIVDTLGGIEVNPATAVEDGYRQHEGGPIIPLYFPPGPQRLSGEQALWYARTRRQGADYARMSRQQEVLVGLQQQALQVGTLTHLPDIWTQVKELVQTDLSLAELITLAPVVLDLSRERITHLVIDWHYVQPMKTPEGWQVLEPRWEEIQRAVRATLYDIKVHTSVGQVEIVNQSGRAGLADRAALLLTRQGISKTAARDEVAPGEKVATATVVRAQAGHRQEGLLVARLLGLADGQVKEEREGRGSGGPALRVFLGQDAPKLE